MSRRQPPAPEASAPVGSGETRLQKVLSAAGLGSRRQCEELLLTGRVEVDRRVVTELGAKANPATQEIRVDGQVLRPFKPIYYLVNKPVGVVSTNADPAGRPRVIDLVPDKHRVFSVGRLDLASEGLILLTNDGELANQLTHPRYGVEKTYLVEVVGKIERRDLERLRRGVHLAEGLAKVAEITVKKVRPKSTQLEMVLCEGKNREVRRVLARVGHKVIRLRRIAIGQLRLADLEPGAYRPLTRQEVKALRDEASPEAHRRRKLARAARRDSAKERASEHEMAPPPPPDPQTIEILPEEVPIRETGTGNMRRKRAIIGMSGESASRPVKKGARPAKRPGARPATSDKQRSFGKSRPSEARSERPARGKGKPKFRTRPGKSNKGRRD